MLHIYRIHPNISALCQDNALQKCTCVPQLWTQITKLFYQHFCQFIFYFYQFHVNIHEFYLKVYVFSVMHDSDLLRDLWIYILVIDLMKCATSRARATIRMNTACRILPQNGSLLHNQIIGVSHIWPIVIYFRKPF